MVRARVLCALSRSRMLTLFPPTQQSISERVFRYFYHLILIRGKSAHASPEVQCFDRDVAKTKLQKKAKLNVDSFLSNLNMLSMIRPCVVDIVLSIAVLFIRSDCYVLGVSNLNPFPLFLSYGNNTNGMMLPKPVARLKKPRTFM